MKRRLRSCIVLMVICLASAPAFGEEGAQDPGRLFYKANALYEKGEYQKCIDEYLKILATGSESGRLYYNLGNSYFKLGRPGRAILYYEKARRLIPQDGDLKSNLDYARSLTGEIIPPTGIKRTMISIIKRPFMDFDLNALSVASAILYLMVILIAAASLVSPVFYKKIKGVFFTLLFIFAASAVAFGMRYYDEEMVNSGVIIKNGAECKYEPIDKSTTYFTLPEGSAVSMRSVRDGWAEIKRPDGKVGWVTKDSVEEI